MYNLCPVCGKEGKRKRDKFCSTKCFQLYAKEQGKLLKKRNEKKYNGSPKLCKQCNTILSYKDKKLNKQFCNSSCSAKYHNKSKKKTKLCIECKEPIKNYATYCSRTCEKKHKHDQYIKRWKKGEESGIMGKGGTRKQIHKYIRDKYDNKCVECGWNKVNQHTGNVPVQLEHIDGNWKNNKEENLTLLCPSCHSLTKTYGGANKGKGRSHRMKNYYLGKAY